MLAWPGNAVNLAAVTRSRAVPHARSRALRGAAVPPAATTWKPFFAGGGRAGARIWRGAAGWRLAGLVRPGRGFFVPAVAVAGMIGGGLPVTPVKFGDTSPLETLAPGP